MSGCFSAKQYVTFNGLTNIKHLAYKIGHSTETELLSMKKEIYLSIARGDATAIMLLDNQ